MSDQTCDCCGEMTVGQSTEPTPSSDRWLDERPVTDAPLPSDVASTMSRFLGESIQTDGFVTAARDATGGGTLAVDDLCHTSSETPHRATVEDGTYHFECFYDGVALAHLVDESVEVRTESPAHDLIEMRVSAEGDIDATPSDAVMSFGIAVDMEPPAADGRPVGEAAVAAMCPYVKAFPTRESYERWAETADAATVGMPLTAGVPIAAALAE